MSGHRRRSLRRLFIVAATSAVLGADGAMALAGDDATPAPAPQPATAPQGPSAKFVGEIAGAAMVGWIRDPSATVEGVAIQDWLWRTGSSDAAVAASARRTLIGLGRDALPWIAIGLGTRSAPWIHRPCAEIAEALAQSGAFDLGLAATDPRVGMRRVALAGARRGGLPESTKRDALQDDDPTVRREAALGFLSATTVSAETLEALEAAWTDADEMARTAAALALLRAGGARAQRLAISLQRPEARDKLLVTCLLEMPAEAEDALHVLLASPSWHVRAHAVTALAFAPRLTEGSVQAVVRALEDPSGDVRWRAACALDRPEARGSETALRARLSDPLLDVRAASAVALSTLGAMEPDAIPPLVAALLLSKPQDEMGNLLPLHEDSLLAHWYLVVAQTLPVERVVVALGKHGAAGVAALRKASKSADPSARRLAIAVYASAGDAGTESLRGGLADADEGVRRAAAIGLAGRGDATAEVVGTLARNVSNDPTIYGRSGRLDALLSLGPAALPAIRALLAKGDEELQPGLVAALVRMGERAAPAVPEVLGLDPSAIKILPGEGSSATSMFEKAIRAIGPAGVPGLIAAVRSEDAVARERAFRACLLLGPAAKAALPALHEALAAKRIPGLEDCSASDPIHPIE